MEFKYILLIALVASISLASGYVIANPDLISDVVTPADVIVYKSSSCGCCGGYVSALEEQGFDVKAINVDDTRAVKSKYDIPHNMMSCHTAVWGDYFVEGHVPMEAVEKMLAEQPDIDGISLPGMLAGSPGMPGVQKEPFVIYAITDGEATEFMTI